MRITHLLWSFNTGGIQTMLTDISNIMAEENDVSVVVMDCCPHMDLVNKLSKKIRFISCERPIGSRNLWYVLKLNWFLFLLKPDILHIHMNGLVNLVKIPLVAVRTYHNTGHDNKEYRKYSRCFAISESVRTEWGKKNCPLVLIENGIDCNKIKQKEFGNPQGLFKIIQVSRFFIKQKGQDLLIEALSCMKNLDSWRLYLVGDGEDEQYLKNLVKEKGIDDRVCFLGYKDRDWIYEHLCDYDLFVQPSRYEGYGLTVAEACAARLPVLVSSIEGPMEIINYGECGVYFENNNKDDLYHKIESIILYGYDMKKIESAYNRVMYKYDVRKTTEAYLSEYKKIVK